MLWSNLFTTQLRFIFFTPPCWQEGQNPPYSAKQPEGSRFSGGSVPKTLFHASVSSLNPRPCLLIPEDSFPAGLLALPSCTDRARPLPHPRLQALMFALACCNFLRSTSQPRSFTPALPLKWMNLYSFGPWPCLFPALPTTRPRCYAKPYHAHTWSQGIPWHIRALICVLADGFLSWRQAEVEQHCQYPYSSWSATVFTGLRGLPTAEK